MLNIYHILPAKKIDMREKQERTIIHLEYQNEHFYYGSQSAIYTEFSAKQLGIALGTLRNFGIKEDKPYKNDKCIIRKGTLKTIPKQNK